MSIEYVSPVMEKYSPSVPIALEIGEINDWDFSGSADQIFRILTVMDLANLIDRNPFSSTKEVKATIFNLIKDIDLNSDELQISEQKYIRIEFRDELLSLEVFLGV